MNLWKQPAVQSNNTWMWADIDRKYLWRTLLLLLPEGRLRNKVILMWSITCCKMWEYCLLGDTAYAAWPQGGWGWLRAGCWRKCCFRLGGERKFEYGGIIKCKKKKKKLNMTLWEYNKVIRGLILSESIRDILWFISVNRLLVEAVVS